MYYFVFLHIRRTYSHALYLSYWHVHVMSYTFLRFLHLDMLNPEIDRSKAHLSSLLQPRLTSHAHRVIQCIHMPFLNRES